MKKPFIYLASSSPRRRKLLREMGIRFRVIRPSYVERPIPGLSPAALVKTHARKKAESVARTLENGLVLAADTIVYFRGQVLGKPRDWPHAIRMLGQLTGRSHAVYSGVALFEVKAGKTTRREVFHVKTKVWMKRLEGKALLAYLKKIGPLDKAGAYAVQSRHAPIVERIDGSFSNVAGLPLERLKRSFPFK